MINRLLSLASRRCFQPLWRGVFNIALGGLGHMNADAAINGENRYLAVWAARCRAAGKATPVIFDIGANEGDFTAEAVKWVPEARIHCFEPNPATFARLEARFQGYRQIVLNRAGVGDAPGTLRLFDYAGSSGSGHASFLAETFSDIYPSDARPVDVPVTSVDTYLKDNAIVHVDFLKVDVEGFEKNVFMGMKDALVARRVSVIQFEFNAHNAITGLSLYRIGQFLKGYDIFKILPDGLEPVLTETRPYNARIEIFKYANYAAILRS